MADLFVETNSAGDIVLSSRDIDRPINIATAHRVAGHVIEILRSRKWGSASVRIMPNYSAVVVGGLDDDQRRDVLPYLIGVSDQ